METIISFECKNCGHKIGQYILNRPEKDKEKDIECPKCHSTNYEYKMKL